MRTLTPFFLLLSPAFASASSSEVLSGVGERARRAGWREVLATGRLREVEVDAAAGAGRRLAGFAGAVAALSLLQTGADQLDELLWEEQSRSPFPLYRLSRILRLLVILQRRSPVLPFLLDLRLVLLLCR